MNLRALTELPSFRSPGHGAVLTEAQEEQAEACGRHQDGTTLLALEKLETNHENRGVNPWLSHGKQNKQR